MKVETIHAWYVRQREMGWQKSFAWTPQPISMNESVWFEWYERKVVGMSDSSDPSTLQYNHRALGSNDENGYDAWLH